MQLKLIYTREVSHVASFWKWEFLELGNGLSLFAIWTHSCLSLLLAFSLAFSKKINKSYPFCDHKIQPSKRYGFSNPQDECGWSVFGWREKDGVLQPCFYRYFHGMSKNQNQNINKTWFSKNLTGEGNPITNKFCGNKQYPHHYERSVF